MTEGAEIPIDEAREAAVSEAYAKSKTAAEKYKDKQFPKEPSLFQKVVGGAKEAFGTVLVPGIENVGTERAAKAREVALTCDDGPTEQTLEILDHLERNGAKATFFWFVEDLKQIAEENPDLLKQILDSVKRTGSEIGLHGDYRIETTGLKSRFLGEILIKEMKEDKEEMERIIKEFSKEDDFRIEAFRFHNWHLGPLSEKAGKAARSLGMVPVGLSLKVGVEATALSVRQNIEIFNSVASGSIVDIHEKKEEKVTSPLEVIPPLVLNLNLKRFKFATVSEVTK